MKKNTILLFLMSIMWIFASCTNELDEYSYKMDNEIAIDAIIDGQVPGTTRAATETTTANLTQFNLLMSLGTTDYSALDTYNVSSGTVSTTPNTAYYWPATEDVTFRATGAPTAWADVTRAGITKTSYTAGASDTADPVVAVKTTNKATQNNGQTAVPMTFYHALSRICIHYVGTEYVDPDGTGTNYTVESSKGIYVVPVSHYFHANTSGDFSYTGTTIDGKWNTTDNTNCLLYDAWSNQVQGNTFTQTYSLTGSNNGTNPTNTYADTWVNVIPGTEADYVYVKINICNSTDGTVITNEKVLTLTLPAIHNHNCGNADKNDKVDYENDGDENFSSENNTTGDTKTELTGGKYQPGYGYIYDVKFYVKKDITGNPGTNDDYDIEPIVIGTIAVDPWTDQHAGEIIYGK